MVIKGSAAKRDGERLHPAADVEQEGMKKKERQRGEILVCKDRRKERRHRKGKKENGKTEKEIRKVWMVTGNERLEAWGSQPFWSRSPVLHGSTRCRNGNETNVLLMWSKSHCTNTRTSTAIICLIPCVHLNGPFRTSAAWGFYRKEVSGVVSS